MTPPPIGKLKIEVVRPEFTLRKIRLKNPATLPPLFSKWPLPTVRQHVAFRILNLMRGLEKDRLTGAPARWLPSVKAID